MKVSLQPCTRTGRVTTYPNEGPVAGCQTPPPGDFSDGFPTLFSFTAQTCPTDEGSRSYPNEGPELPQGPVGTGPVTVVRALAPPCVFRTRKLLVSLYASHHCATASLVA